jgi:hypothetical protein
MRNTNWMMLAGTFLIVAACDKTASPLAPQAAIAVSVTVPQTQLAVGQTTTATATVENATNSAVTWRSSAPAVATVTSSGVITAIAPGIAAVSAASVQDTTRKGGVVIVVVPAGVGTIPGFAITPAVMTLTVGGRGTMSFNVGDATSTIWRTSAPAIATVSAYGEVVGVATGEAVITAISMGDTTRRANAVVRVRTVIPPDTMRILGVGIVTERFTGEVAVRGNWAYTSTWSNRNGIPGNVVKIWNVTGNTPVLTDSLKIPGATTTGDVQISDDGALLVVAVEPNPNGAIMIYDLTNPARPDSLARFRSANTQQGVHTVKLGRVNNRHYAFLSIDPGSTPARLTIVDITNPRAPVEVFSQQMGAPYVHDVFVRDGILFAALWDDGLRIFDIGGGNRGGSPSNPVVISSLRTVSGNIHNIWWFHDPTNNSRRYVFLGEEGPGSVGGGIASGDIHVIDISDMANPVQVAQYNVPSAGTHNFWMDEASGMLYAAYYNAGVRALDVRGDLGTCMSLHRNQHGFCDLAPLGRERAVGLTAGGYVWGVVYQNSRVYASDMRQGLYVLDASALRRN